MKTPALDGLLRDTSRSRHAAELKRLALRAWVMIAGAFAAATVIDVVYALPMFGLLLLDGVLLGMTFWALRPFIHQLRRGPDGERRAAVFLERRLGVPDNRLINALDLAREDAGTDSAVLRKRAVALGESAARECRGRPVTDPDRVRRSVVPAAAALAGLALAYLLVPSVFRAVPQRLAAPFADHPPFTTAKFRVAVAPEPVYYGKPATIQAVVTGPRTPGDARVVFDDDGVASVPLPMRRPAAANREEAAQGAARFELRIDRVESPLRFYIDTPRGRSGWHTLAPDTSPLVEQQTVTYEYPDYTGWPDTTGPLSDAGIRALAGTRITLHVQSNVALRGGSLVRMPGESEAVTASKQSVPLVVDDADPRVASANFVLTYTGMFRPILHGEDGREGVRLLDRAMVALPDRAPKIEIMQPQRQAVAPVGWPVDAEMLAGDDIGLGAVELHVAVNDASPTPVQLTTTYRDTRRTTAASGYTLDPQALGAVAGDTIRYYATARDNHPGAAQTAATPVHAVHLITMQQYLDLARMRYDIDDVNAEFEAIRERLSRLEAQRDALLAELDEQREFVATDEPPDAARRERLGELGADSAAYADQAAALAEALRARSGQATLYDFEEAYKRLLTDLASEIEEQGDRARALAQALDGLAKDGDPGARRAVGRLADAFASFGGAFTEQMREATASASRQLAQVAEGRNAPGAAPPGETPDGLAGSLVRMPMVGPDLPGPAGIDSLAQQGRRGAAEGGAGRPAFAAGGSAGAAEVIHAERTARASDGIGGLQGVPAEYREQAEAYFRRLAEERR
jgi:hypothetical protein